jgi:cytochrome c oxidase subunit IV
MEQASARPYLLTFAALLVLTGATVAIAHVHLGALNLPVALAIAGAKALLVLLVFMHVRNQTRLVVAYVAGGLFWLGILLVLTLSDYLTRGAFGFP